MKAASSFLPRHAIWWSLGFITLCGLMGWIGGTWIGNTIVERREEWKRFEASHGGCSRTGGYDTIEGMQPVYSVNGQGHLYVLSWTPTTDYVYHWQCQDGTTYKR